MIWIAVAALTVLNLLNWLSLLKLERRLDRMAWLSTNPLLDQAKKHPAAHWPPPPNRPDPQDWQATLGRGWDANAGETDDRDYSGRSK